MKKTGSRRRQRFRKLELDEAFIALFIGAMNANRQVTPEEAARAHHLIWSTRRFRRKSGETVGRLIDRMKVLLEDQAAQVVIDAAARTIPARQRASAFALVTDLLLADGKVDTQERRFLQRLSADLQIPRGTARQIVEVMLVKNHL
jgi:tellurite resistance protein